jgi:hypothetical protein
MTNANEKLLDEFVWIRLKQPDDFLKIRETLTRIGVAAKGEKRLYQSCHILHKQGRYAIVHFKELLALDGKTTNFSDEDRQRRNTIAGLLEQWGLLELEEPSKIEEKAPLSIIKIVPFKEKSEWQLNTKYSIGTSRK